jgi:predicted nucleic acid-binding protein
MKIVLDTNVLLQIISSRSIHHWLWEALRRENLVLCLTTDKHFNEVKNKDLFFVKIISPSEFREICKHFVEI